MTKPHCLECALRDAVCEFFGDSTENRHSAEVIFACASIIGSIAAETGGITPKLHQLLDEELASWRDIYASEGGRQH